MARRLPALSQLRAFEVAARRESFSKAADELNLTPSAVSHQIKALELDLGVALFHRAHRHISLTAEGKRIYPLLHQAFEDIHKAIDRLIDRDPLGPVTLSVVPTFAVRWLIPHLADFHRRHPEIEVRLSTSSDRIDFADTDFDAAIRFGFGKWEGLQAVHLLREELLPVCSPALLKDNPPLREPRDLVHFTLLHDLHRPDVWRVWLTAVGVTDIDPTQGIKFDTTNLAVQAAIHGLGIIPISKALVTAELAAGTLIAPIDIPLPIKNGYYLVYPNERADHPRLQVFEAWLLENLADIDP